MGTDGGNMSTLPFDEDILKRVFKAAIVEVLEERRDLVRDLLEEALEDIGLVYAIADGEHTANVSRDEVFAIFDIN